MNDSTYLYSIGHGHKTPEEFVEELRSFGIQYVIDVRTTPFSRWAPLFNRDSIARQLKNAGVVYVYMGDTIGGKPKNDGCYDSNGFLDYKEMAKRPVFQKGLERLVTANNRGLRVAIMCSESDPSQCHRSRLIGRELYFNSGINMMHIIAVGKARSQTQIMTELTEPKKSRADGYGWLSAGDLFGACDPPYFHSLKTYKNLNPEQVDYYD